jgi:MFS family permease
LSPVPGPASDPPADRVWLAVLVAALGYFVDIYDIILFTIVRVPSLQSLGVAEAQRLDTGAWLLNWQNIGMVLGGLLWGILGDKRGRLSVLFGSILLYSTCNIANGYVTTVEQYTVLRFLAGVGLAGELGAGVTLVSEIMSRANRGWGSTIIGAVGMCGGITAGLVGGLTPWREAYIIGGVLGFLLFALRVGVRESSLFRRTQVESGRRGNLLLLFSSSTRVVRYFSLIAVAMPIWYVVGILTTFAPELARAHGMAEIPTVSRAVTFDYVGLIAGNLTSSYLSQRWKTRKRVLWIFLLLSAVSTGWFFYAFTTLPAFYGACVLAGFSTGYWPLFVLMTAEQFGTNVRATATTTAPNLVRGAIVPMTLAFQWLKAPLGVSGSALAVGAAVGALAIVALAGLGESYGRDLDFVDEWGNAPRASA